MTGSAMQPPGDPPGDAPPPPAEPSGPGRGDRPPPSLSTALARTAGAAGGADPSGEDPGRARTARATTARRAFERLIGEVEAARETLGLWQRAHQRYLSHRAAEVEPDVAAFRADQRRIVTRIDALLDPHATPRRTIGRAVQAQLRRLLIGLVGSLLADVDDPELIAIHDRHAGVGHAEARAAELAATRAMLEDTFGLELGADDDATTPDTLLERAAAQLRAADDAEDAARAARRASRARAKAGTAGQGGTTPGTTRDLKFDEAGRSVREIYRQLASALHPDREPDPAERDRKTRLMQRVNDAYAASDLLGLLELQLEVDRFDPARITAASEQRLASYGRVLREQLKRLRDEIDGLQAPFDDRPARRGAAPSWHRPGPSATPEQIVDRVIDAERAQLRDQRESHARIEHALDADPRRIGTLLRQLAADITGDAPFEPGDDAPTGFDPAPTPTPGRGGRRGRR